LKGQLQESYKELEARLEEKSESMNSSRKYARENSRYISATDPDAGIVNRGKPKLSYQVHRAVDGRSEVITAMETTSGDVNEAHEMIPLLETHHLNTGVKVDTVVADSKYGTVENFLACYDRGVEAHIPDLKEFTSRRMEKLNLFSEERLSMMRTVTPIVVRLGSG